MKQIYALIDPRTGDIRYIGKGVAKTRLRGHIRDGRRPVGNTHKYHWLRQLLSEDLLPEVLILEDGLTDETLLNQSERDWIAWGRACEWPLTNLTDGGDGGDTWSGKKRGPFSDEHRAKLSAARKKRPGVKDSDEVRRNKSAARMGIMFSDEHRANLAKAKLGNKNASGKRTPEQCARIRAGIQRARS